MPRAIDVKFATFTLRSSSRGAVCSPPWADHRKLFHTTSRLTDLCSARCPLRCPRLSPSGYSARHGNPSRDGQRRFEKCRDSFITGRNSGRIGARFWRRRRRGWGRRRRSPQILSDLPARPGGAELPVSNWRQLASQSALPTRAVMRHAQWRLWHWSTAELLPSAWIVPASITSELQCTRVSHRKRTQFRD